MPRKDAAPPETAVQRAVREFYIARWNGTGKSCGWDRDKHGKFRAEFARDAEAAWHAAMAFAQSRIKLWGDRSDQR
jgi:hypothetical protein